MIFMFYLVILVSGVYFRLVNFDLVDRNRFYRLWFLVLVFSFLMIGGVVWLVGLVVW